MIDAGGRLEGACPWCFFQSLAMVSPNSGLQSLGDDAGDPFFLFLFTIVVDIISP